MRKCELGKMEEACGNPDFFWRDRFSEDGVGGEDVRGESFSSFNPPSYIASRHFWVLHSLCAFTQTAGRHSHSLLDGSDYTHARAFSLFWILFFFSLCSFRFCFGFSVADGSHVIWLHTDDSM